MAKAFDTWYKQLIPWEGTIADWERQPANRADRGGLTNLGVTIGTWNSFAVANGWQYGEDGLRNMSGKQHRIIAKSFWDSANAGALAPSVAIMHADTAWGSGIANAARILQRAINRSGGSVRVDGAVGPITITEANSLPADKLLANYRNERESFLRSIVQNDPSQGVFLQGWLNRVSAIYDSALPYLKKKQSGFWQGLRLGGLSFIF